jgi:isoleucyl-tRNA synthetase
MTGFINDSQGRKMSKSLGNVISPNELTDKHGADTFRYYSIGAANPGLDLNYNMEDAEVKRRNLSILWNLHNFVIDLSHTVGKNPAKLTKSVLANATEEEKYIFSKLNSTIKKTTQLMDTFKLNEVPWAVEELYLELSRTYIQMVREKANTGSDDEKEVVLYTVYHVLFETLKLLSPVVPLITEQAYQNFKIEFGLKEESIHLFDYPKADEKKIDETLEQDITYVKDVIQAVLSAREKAQIGIRWPLSDVVIETTDDATIKAISDLENLIKSQANVKKLSLVKKFDKADITVKPNYKTLGPEFGKESQLIIKWLSETENSSIVSLIKDGKLKIKSGGKEFNLEEKHLIMEKSIPKEYTLGEFTGGNIFLLITQTEELISEGYAREVVRRVQSFRKDAGLKKKDSIELYLKLDNELYHHLLSYKNLLNDRVGAKTVELSLDVPKKKYKHTGIESVKGHSVEAFFQCL